MWWGGAVLVGLEARFGGLAVLENLAGFGGGMACKEPGSELAATRKTVDINFEVVFERLKRGSATSLLLQSGGILVEKIKVEIEKR